MAYAAVISLKQTIDRLLDSSYISVVSSVLETIELAYKEVESLQRVLRRLDYSSSSSSRDSERVYALDGEIREAVWILEDVIESHVSNLLLSHNYEESSGDPFLFSVDLQEDVDSFIRKAKKMEEDYIKELSNQLPKEDGDYAVSVSSRIDFGGEKIKMIGLSGAYDDDDVTSRIDFGGRRMKIDLDSLLGTSHRLKVVSLVGMAGIGKTTLATKIYKNTSFMGRFTHRAWVNVGPEYKLEEIIERILLQLDPGNSEVLLEKSNREQWARLYLLCSQVRYLIVLDDVWDRELWDGLRRCFPQKRNGSRVLLTSRQVHSAIGTSSSDLNIFRMSLLDEEESWYFLCEKVFPNESCPRQLVEAGKKIAKKCDGLPLTIATVADILSKAPKTQEYWNKVATEKKNSIFMDAYNQLSKVLLPSYYHLPQRLQTCFLYMGVFPEDYVIPRSKFIKLWSAEAFLEPAVGPFHVESFIMKCLEDLFDRSLLIERQRSSNHRFKTCNLNAAYWHLSNIEAGKNKTFHVLDTFDDISIEGIKSQRRLSVQTSVLFNIKDAYGSMTSILSLRSILCTGQYYQYPVQICSSWKLLRVLDALAIRFYQFPIEVLKLVHVMYLAITYHGKLPALISNLWNLQSLIVHRHWDIKFSKDPSYLPVEIWEMEELRHLQVTGSDLPDPPCDAVLPNLLTLLDVSAQSCTRKVFESIPKLKKLGIRVELTPDSAVVPLHFFGHISYLRELESLKCVVVNPILKSEVAAPPASFPIMLPTNLKKLNLSGCGFPWEYMNKILSLPRLEVLKLRSYDFCGPVWELQNVICRGLYVLILEDVDLVEWSCARYAFPYLKRLIIRHCYKLKGIPSHFGFIESLELIELVDCSRDAVDSAEVIRKEQERHNNLGLQVRISSSCE